MTQIDDDKAAGLLARGNRLAAAGELGPALEAYAAATLCDPALSTAYGNIGQILAAAGQWRGALAARRTAWILSPGPETQLSLAEALAALGDPAAVAAWSAAVVFDPASPPALFGFVGGLAGRSARQSALRWGARLVRLVPGHAPTRYNLGDLALSAGLLGLARRELAAALVLAPGHAGALGDLANLSIAAANPAAGLPWFDRLLRLVPDLGPGWSNRLFAIHSAVETEAEFHAAAVGWAGRHPLPDSRPRRRCRRRLRVGYVSPDFRRHSVAAFVEPLLAAHDRDEVSVYAYAELPHPDETSARLRSLTDHWRHSDGLSDAECAARIRDDEIDVLVDLAGHSGGNRLGVLALGPAPIQLSWLGFNATTGLGQIDWRLTDPWAAPPGAEAFFAEGLWRLPRPAHVWHPPADAPAVADRRGEAITFGSFNNPAKIGRATIELWAAALRAVPRARLLLKGAGLDEPGTRDRLEVGFAAAGIAADRLDLRGWAGEAAAHLEAYGEVDLALDPFPYHGVTTTCEALWMGVPVVSLQGGRTITRMGAGLLAAVGLNDFAVSDTAQFVARAVALAADAAARAELRRTLRLTMAASPLCDDRGFARVVEAAYRRMAML